MTLPLTVLLPNYNHAHFLPGAIESVLAQSFSHFELLIVDDGSTDASVEIIHDYMKKDKRICLIKHGQNRGIAEAFKTGVGVAKGIYFQQFSASDLLVAGCLEKSLNMLLRYPDIGLCCTDVGLFDDDPAVYKNFPQIENASRPLVFPPSTIQRVFKYARLFTMGMGSIVKRSSFMKYGGYDKSLYFMCDWILNHQIALYEGAIYIPETLTVFRKNEFSKNTSDNPQIRTEALKNLTRMLLRPEKRDLLKKMKKSATLGILGKERILDILVNPPLWSVYSGLGVRYFYTHLRRGLRLPLVTEAFLEKHALPANV